MTKKLLTIGSIIAASTLASQAALIWTGNGDGADLFSEANWMDNNSAVPATGTINPNAPVTAATGGLILINTGTGPSSFSGHFTLGNGNDIEVGGGKNLASTATYGLRVLASAGATHVSGTLSGGSMVDVQFVLDIDWTLEGDSTLQLRGGGNPLNESTVDFLDTDSQLVFTNETVADFTSQHLGKVKVLGQPAVIGTNIQVVSNGTGGSIVTVIPEPSSTALLGLAGLAFILRRRK